MFARDFVDLDLPFTDVAARFVPDTTWLVPIAEGAVRSARSLASRLAGLEPGTAADVSGTVRCDAGPVRAVGPGILVPVLIAGSGDAGWAHLVGELDVAPVGRTQTQIVCNVTYRRPSRAAEARTRVERAVAAGVREFLRGMAEHLGASVAGPVRHRP